MRELSRNEKPKTKQVLDFMAKLGGKVNWDTLTAKEVQRMSDNIRLTGAHFEAFLRQGGRISTDQLPIKLITSVSISLPMPDFATWEAQVAYAKKCVGTSSIASGFHNSMVMTNTILKPSTFKKVDKIRVHLFKVCGEAVDTERLIQLFELWGSRPSTIPEGFLFCNTRVSSVLLSEGVTLLKASRNETYTDTQHMLLKGGAPYPYDKEFEFSVVGGDIDDTGNWYPGSHFLATEYL